VVEIAVTVAGLLIVMCVVAPRDRGQRLALRCHMGATDRVRQPMPDIQAMTKQLSDQLKRESESLELWNSFEPVTVTDERRKTFNVRSEMITRCKLNIQKYRETIAALEEQAGK
jgi:hypothetical protein